MTDPGCSNCGNELPIGARFCNQCGTPVKRSLGAREPSRIAAAPTARNGLATQLPWGIAAVGLFALSAYFLANDSDVAGKVAPVADGASSGPMTGAPFSPNGGSGAPPDISSMSPRQRAAKLFDRVMRYAAEGKTDSLMFFAPMAMASFDMLGGELDVDARYDFGRLAIEAGSPEVASAQADTILKTSPTHLLGLALSARASVKQGNTARANKLWKAFIDAKDAELKKNLPEYQSHAAEIQSATQLAKGGT